MSFLPLKKYSPSNLQLKISPLGFFQGNNMKKRFVPILAITAAIICGPALAEEKSVYQCYQDWQFQPVTVASTNADSLVRHQMDFTVPTHGPWLINPSYDSITVNWITRVPCGAAIDYRKKGEKEFKRIWKTTYGQIDYSSDMHPFHLTGLEPATDYEYRLVSTMSTYKTAYCYAGVFEGREIHSFRTLDPKLDRYQVFVTADLHGSARLCLDPMIENCGATNALLHFFLGDNVEDNMNDARYNTTFGFLDDVCRRWGKDKATVFLRGNHDTWGPESYKWRDYFPRLDEKSYQAVSAGPVLFICLDTMAAGYGSAINRKIVADYYEEQAQWIRDMKKTPTWKNARFRIVMAHFGSHGGEQQKLVSDTFKNVLNETGKDKRIHLFLAGHDHSYARFDPKSVIAKAGPYPSRNTFSNDFNYAEVYCHIQEGMTIDVTKDKLTIKSHLWSKYPGTGLRDAFELLPDGSVHDLMEVKTYNPPGHK